MCSSSSSSSSTEVVIVVVVTIIALLIIVKKKTTPETKFIWLHVHSSIPTQSQIPDSPAAVKMDANSEDKEIY